MLRAHQVLKKTKGTTQTVFTFFNRIRFEILHNLDNNFFYYYSDR